MALLCIAAVALFGAMILLPIYLQNVRGLSTLETGLLLLPGGLLMGLLGPLVGRLFDKHGPRGAVHDRGVAAGADHAGVDPGRSDDTGPAAARHSPAAVDGLAFLFTPAFTTALNPLPPHLYSHGSAILSTLQQVSGAAGVALLVAIVTLRTESAAAAGAAPIAAEVAGLHLAFLVAAGIGLVAVGLALTLRRTEVVAPDHGPRPEPTDDEIAVADVDLR